MAQQTLNNGVSGKVFRDILNQNFTDLYTNKAPKITPLRQLIMV